MAIVPDPAPTGAGAVLSKRTWHYLMPPKAFEVAACACGNVDTQWSEFAEHLWCAKCQIDFRPGHAGIFDGPIPYHAAVMLGLSFDRMNLETRQVETYVPGEGYRPRSTGFAAQPGL